MQFDIPTLYVPYGPVGHPRARAYVDQISLDREQLEQAFVDWLLRRRIQSDIPGLFFDKERALGEQGYYVLPVKNGEVSDALLESLKPADIFVPRPAGQPGRKLADVAYLLPSYLDLANLELWTDHPECDHDMGLETWQTVFRTASGHLLSDTDSCQWNGPGTFFNVVTCTRCGARHAYPEQGS